MRNKITVLLIILLCFVLLGATFLFGKKIGEKQSIGVQAINSESSLQNKTSLEQQEDNRQFQQVVETRDLDKCGSLQNQEMQNDCRAEIAMNLAIEKGDVTYCENINSENLKRVDCENAIKFDKVNKEQSVEACNEILDENVRQNCQFNFYNTKAIETKDAAVCENIVLQINKDLCRENVTNAE